jgi:hypothetical protein
MGVSSPYMCHVIIEGSSSGCAGACGRYKLLVWLIGGQHMFCRAAVGSKGTFQRLCLLERQVGRTWFRLCHPTDIIIFVLFKYRSSIGHGWESERYKGDTNNSSGYSITETIDDDVGKENKMVNVAHGR